MELSIPRNPTSTLGCDVVLHMPVPSCAWTNECKMECQYSVLVLEFLSICCNGAVLLTICNEMVFSNVSVHMH